MPDRNLSLLNSQVVINSGSITNPNSSSSIIRNSQRVRNDLLNLSEYINGLVYYLAKSLANGTEHPYDAAQVGLSGLTIFSNTEATSEYTDVFWLSTGENVGRPKTIKESLETMEAKLVQQQQNISILERVDITALTAAVNTSNALVYKVKNNVLGRDYVVGSNDLSYPISEYIYRLYLTLFPDSGVGGELSTNVEGFPALNFSTEVSQTDIPGCGNFLNLEEELASVKDIISGAACDPSFEVTLDQAVFNGQPSNIKDYIDILQQKAVSLSSEVLENATDIANIETQIGGLQGASTATEDVAGISEQATAVEILAGLNFSGNNNLFINPRSFCDSILNTDKTSFFAPNNGLGDALKQATKYSVEKLYETEFKESFSTYLVLDANINTSYQGAFNRHYTVNSRETTVTVTMTNLTDAKNGEIFRVKNSGLTGTVIINPGNGYTIDGNASITLNAKDCITIMFTDTSDHIVVNRYTA